MDDLQKNWKDFLPAGIHTPSLTEPVKLDKSEWQKRLPQESYRVLREEATERAGTSPLNQEKRAEDSCAPAAACRSSARP